MKKVLLFNQGNTCNIGDNAINNVIKKVFEKEEIEYDFFDYWIEEKIFGNLYIKQNRNFLYKIILKLIFHFQLLLDLLYTKYLKKNIILKNYDSIVIGGGELLCGHKGFNTAIYNISRLAEHERINLYLIGVSGDLRMPQKRLDRYLISLKRFKKIFVRDKYTKNILDSYYKIESSYYPDVVFSYNKVFYNQNTMNKENYLLFVPICFNDNFTTTLKINNEYELVEYYMNIIHEEFKDYDKLYIATTTSEDISIANKIVLILKNENINFEYIDCKSLDVYLQLVAKTKRIISGRMHAMIIGAIFNNSFRAIPFKEKLINFEKEYSDINIKKIEELSYDSMIELCAYLRGEDSE